MKPRSTQNSWIFLWVLLTALIGLVGCVTSESENLSERPWNTPKGWETGLPSSMNEGR